MVGVGVEPRLEEPPPVLGGKAGGVSGSASFKISLNSEEKKHQNKIEI